jgi:hypothetical protein
MSGENFQTPVVKLAAAVASDPEQGIWRIPATQPDGLVAVEITQTGLRDFLGAATTDFVELEKLLVENLPRVEKFVAGLEIDGWPDGHGVTPVFASNK